MLDCRDRSCCHRPGSRGNSPLGLTWKGALFGIRSVGRARGPPLPRGPGHGRALHRLQGQTDIYGCGRHPSEPVVPPPHVRSRGSQSPRSGGRKARRSHGDAIAPLPAPSSTVGRHVLLPPPCPCAFALSHKAGLPPRTSPRRLAPNRRPCPTPSVIVVVLSLRWSKLSIICP